jgi:hypothetical protein
MAARRTIYGQNVVREEARCVASAPRSHRGKKKGLPSFEHLVKLGTLKSVINIKNSIDPVASSLINEGTELKLKKITNFLRINWPVTSADIDKAKKRLRNKHIKQWADF